MMKNIKFKILIIPVIALLIISISFSFALFNKNIIINKKILLKAGTKYIGIYGNDKNNILLNNSYTFTIENRGIDGTGYDLYLDSDTSIDLSSISYTLGGDSSSSGTLTSSKKIYSGILSELEKNTITIKLTSSSSGTYKGKLRIVYKNYEYVIDYNYTGNYQTFTVPTSGNYKVELWGAQGGNINSTYLGGKGGYTSGTVFLEKGKKIYVYVGKQGSLNEMTKTFNGGGTAAGTDNQCTSGGGATDIRLTSGTWDNFDSLKSRIMVAGAGAGSEREKGAGVAGGLNSTSSYSMLDIATQSSGYAFGIAANAYTGVTASGGGGGYYGGNTGAAHTGGSAGYLSSGGGSSFISGYPGCNSIEESSTLSSISHTGTSSHYSEYVFNNTQMSDGNSNMPVHNGSGTMTGNSGNGYAKITLLKEDIYNYTGSYQTFTVPTSGTYKVELWGAQGGSINTTYLGGKGAYTSGNIYLKKNTKLYLYVGKQGTLNETVKTFNGGGKAAGVDNRCTSGGGATDIRLTSGSWDNFDSLKSRIMVAGAGAGSERNNGAGVGGELNSTTSYSSLDIATQSSGYAFGIASDAITNINASGAGSGYYGGNVGAAHTSEYSPTGKGYLSSAGGSSFISGYFGCNAVSVSSISGNIIHTNQPNHYSGNIFTNSTMIAGNKSMPTHNGLSTMIGNSGNGYSKITYLGQ